MGTSRLRSYWSVRAEILFRQIIFKNNSCQKTWNDLILFAYFSQDFNRVTEKVASIVLIFFSFGRRHCQRNIKSMLPFERRYFLQLSAHTKWHMRICILWFWCSHTQMRFNIFPSFILPPSVVWRLACLPRDPRDSLSLVPARPRTVDFYGW
jgi:hypothetical protein